MPWDLNLHELWPNAGRQTNFELANRIRIPIQPANIERLRTRSSLKNCDAILYARRILLRLYEFKTGVMCLIRDN